MEKKKLSPEERIAKLSAIRARLEAKIKRIDLALKALTDPDYAKKKQASDDRKAKRIARAIEKAAKEGITIDGMKLSPSAVKSFMDELLQKKAKKKEAAEKK